VRTLCGQGVEVLQMRTSALFGAKNIGFFEVFGVCERKDVEPVRIFCGQGEGCQFFAFMCERPFWTAPNK